MSEATKLIAHLKDACALIGISYHEMQISFPDQSQVGTGNVVSYPSPQILKKFFLVSQAFQLRKLMMRARGFLFYFGGVVHH